jgi:hypothetical protein
MQLLTLGGSGDFQIENTASVTRFFTNLRLPPLQYSVSFFQIPGRKIQPEKSNGT